MIEKLEAKLEEIRSQIERVKANLNALVGAEQVLLQLIDEVTESNESEETENATSDD
jgi:hypothetical protein